MTKEKSTTYENVNYWNTLVAKWLPHMLHNRGVPGLTPERDCFVACHVISLSLSPSVLLAPIPNKSVTFPKMYLKNNPCSTSRQMDMIETTVVWGNTVCTQYFLVGIYTVQTVSGIDGLPFRENVKK